MLKATCAAKGTNLAAMALLFQSGFTPERLVPITLRT
jgi:hypothetical protein